MAATLKPDNGEPAVAIVDNRFGLDQLDPDEIEVPAERECGPGLTLDSGGEQAATAC